MPEVDISPDAVEHLINDLEVPRNDIGYDSAKCIEAAAMLRALASELASARQALAAAEQDARRFAWYFRVRHEGEVASAVEVDFIDGWVAGWSLDTWRMKMDEAIAESAALTPPEAPRG